MDPGMYVEIKRRKIEKPSRSGHLPLGEDSYVAREAMILFEEPTKVAKVRQEILLQRNHPFLSEYRRNLASGVWRNSRVSIIESLEKQGYIEEANYISEVSLPIFVLGKDVFLKGGVEECYAISANRPPYHRLYFVSRPILRKYGILSEFESAISALQKDSVASAETRWISLAILRFFMGRENNLRQFPSFDCLKEFVRILDDLPNPPTMTHFTDLANELEENDYGRPAVDFLVIGYAAL